MRLSVHPRATYEGATFFEVHEGGVGGPVIARCDQRRWAEAIVLALSLGDLADRLTHSIAVFFLACNAHRNGGPTAGSELIEVRDLAQEARNQITVLNALVDNRAPPIPMPASTRHLH